MICLFVLALSLRCERTFLRGFKNDISFSILLSLTNDCHLLSEVFRISNELSDAKDCVQNLRELAGVNEELANILGLISRFFKKIS